VRLRSASCGIQLDGWTIPRDPFAQRERHPARLKPGGGEPAFKAVSVGAAGSVFRPIGQRHCKFTFSIERNSTMDLD